MKLTAKQKREADFFDSEYSESYDGFSEQELKSELKIDLNKKLSEYADRYKYAYGLVDKVKKLKVLDLGCGSGIAILAKLGHKVDALDISSKAIEIAKKRTK